MWLLDLFFTADAPWPLAVKMAGGSRSARHYVLKNRHCKSQQDESQHQSAQRCSLQDLTWAKVFLQPLHKYDCSFKRICKHFRPQQREKNPHRHTHLKSGWINWPYPNLFSHPTHIIRGRPGCIFHGRELWEIWQWQALKKRLSEYVAHIVLALKTHVGGALK